MPVFSNNIPKIINLNKENVVSNLLSPNFFCLLKIYLIYSWFSVSFLSAFQGLGTKHRATAKKRLLEIMWKKMVFQMKNNTW